jgi:hypothetical protein
MGVLDNLLQSLLKAYLPSCECSNHNASSG